MSDQISDIQPHWMAAQKQLKNEFTEDKKYHNLMNRLKINVQFVQFGGFTTVLF